MAETGSRTLPAAASPGKSNDLSWTRSADALLGVLEDDSTSLHERDTAVLFAETMEFDESQRHRLLSSLEKYIAENRFATDEEKIAAVGSAIRKYAMNMNEAGFESYADWLRPSRTETLSHLAELELVKGVCWRLAYEPMREKRAYAPLTEVVSEIARDYLTPRLILQKNYASIALHAVSAVVILEAFTDVMENSQQLLAEVASLEMPWFAELLEARLEEYAEVISEHDANLAEVLRARADNLN